MIKIYETQEALDSILKRVPLDDMPISQHLLNGIEKIFGEPLSPALAVRRIIQDVRRNGDLGLRKWSAKLDGLDKKNFRVNKGEIEAAFEKITPEQQQAFQLAESRVRRFYSRQPISSWIMQDGDGTLGQLVRPIKRIGIYIPGGTAPLPSSVIMSVVPAQVAGVREIALVIPPHRETGKIPPITLSAAAMLGIEEVYILGGAQAIAAMAYGTESIPRVDKIFGPGNIFVTLAKRQVFGSVGIDGLAGPTETMIIADETAKAEWIAADLVAQAEHDVLASAILITPHQQLAEQVQEYIKQIVIDQPRAEILSHSLVKRSGIVITKDLEEAVRLANAYAPEHLCLSVSQPWLVSEKIHSAGGIFMGEYSCEVLGDYVSGPSHVMPTSGTARFASPLNLLDFVHLVSLVSLDPCTASELAYPAAVMARSEGLEAHAHAADVRKASEV